MLAGVACVAMLGSAEGAVGQGPAWPETTIVSGPSGLTNDTTPTLGFASPDAAERFQCRLYPAREAVPPAPADCSSPFSAGPLADGAYVFEVAAVNAVGLRDESPEIRFFRIDTAAPRASIVGGPGDTTATDAAFLFTSDELAVLSCRLDGGDWQPCESPQAYSGLPMGPHRFEVRATDRAGNVQSEPTGHSWEVLKPGMRIPAAGEQAVALARTLVQVRQELTRVRLRSAGRRKAITLNGFEAATAGTAALQAKAQLSRRPRGSVRRVPFAAGRRELPTAGFYAVTAKLTPQGRRLARTRRKLPVELTLAFTDRAGRSLWATTTTTMTR